MKSAIYLLCALLGVSCAQNPTTTHSGLHPEAFAATIDGKQNALYTLTNAAGAEVCITNFGARVVSLSVPDREGVLRDVVLGFDNIEDYRNIPSDFGAAIGRYANRIGNGRFTLDGEQIQLPQNNYGHCLHGGPAGWQYKVYELSAQTPNSLTFELHSPDGDANFPGNVVAQVCYTLTEANSLEISYRAQSDRPTIINMTNHSYFCLSGDPATGSMQDELTLFADAYTPVDSTFMTSGEILPVAGTPLDFRQPTPIGSRIDDDFEQLRNGKGYDHNWVLNTAGDSTRCAARLYSPKSGIALEVYTTEPGIQVYTGNFLDGTITGKGGIRYPRRASVCLETQHFPDSPNKPHWASVVLRPHETYSSFCAFRFSAQ